MKIMNWPNDVDGDVFRRLVEEGFDFSKEHTIDLIVDFERWPLSDSVKVALNALYTGCEYIDPDDEDMENGEANGYVQFSLSNKLTYEFIIEKQKQVTEQTKQFGGWCDSWGVEN